MLETKNCKCEKELSEEELLKEYDKVLDNYIGKEGSLIPVLQIAQKLFGYLPEEVLKRVSVKLDIPFSEVAGVLSFYSFFSTFPRGKYLVRVCLGTACYVRGAKEVLESLKNELGIDVGQTTNDKIFSLDVGRCFGACGLAPVIMINDDIYQRVKPAKIYDILNKYKVSNNENTNGVL